MAKRSRKDSAVADAQRAIGTELTPRNIWVKTKGDDHGVSYSVMIKPEEDHEGQIELLRQALQDIPAVPKISPPKHSDEDLLTLIPVSDVHFGMRAWAREAGADYDIKIARKRLIEWVTHVVSVSPQSGTAVLLVNGDLLHMNDDKAQTPKSKHALDVDNRVFLTLEQTIEALCVCTEACLMRHKKVMLVLKPGNHDPIAYMAVLFALAERYRKNDRVYVEKEPTEYWVHKFGKVMLASHHGDKGTAQRMVQYMADGYAKIWGTTTYRYLWTGHLHHHRSQDIGGMCWEQNRAVTEKDAYAANNAYTGRAELQAVTCHKERGETARVRITV